MFAIPNPWADLAGQPVYLSSDVLRCFSDRKSGAFWSCLGDTLEKKKDENTGKPPNQGHPR
jgi:hypothetical protein